MPLENHMIIDFYNRVKTAGTTVFLLLRVMLDAQPQLPKDQDWPKLMQLYEGRVVEIQYDSTGKSFYADWQGRRITDMHLPYDATKTKYLYLDSTGKPLSNKLYQHASPFYGGLASVWETETLYPNGSNKNPVVYGQETAIINAREEEVLPMDARWKSSIGKGLAVCGGYSDPTTIVMYNKLGKKLAECTDCDYGVGVGMDNFWMNSPLYRSRPNHITKLYDLKGRMLYEGSGVSVAQIYNQLPSAGQFMSTSMQPYYRVVRDEIQALSTILNRNGKVVMDSIGMSYFNQGKCQVYKNGLAAVVDTNWKFIVPFSYGYTSVQVLVGHPQGAYLATKNNKTSVIDADNKKLIPLESSGGISFNYKQGYYYEAYDAKRNRLFVGLNGDTLVDPGSYEIEREQAYEIPGFFVRCKSNGLMGYLDQHGKVLIPCRYDKLFYIAQDRMLFFSHDGDCGYMDLQGHVKFSLPGVSKLSTFNRGYALCVLFVTDKKQFRTNEEIHTEGNESYQFQERVIDSTGKFVFCETYPATATVFDKMLVDGTRVVSFFYKGLALAFNKKTNKYGLVNEQMQLVVPVIYDNIDTKAESFEFTWYNVNGRGQAIGHHGVSPNVINGRIKVTLKGVEKVIEPGK